MALASTEIATGIEVGTNTPANSAVLQFQRLESELNARLLERDEAVRCAIIALLSGQNYAIIGPPGTAKSLMITLLAQGCSLTKFVYLMTKFSTPEEVVGPTSLQGMKQDQYRRITTNRAPEAQIVFLDEWTRASSAIINIMLTMMNERVFDNGGSRMSIPLISLFGASNDLPQGNDLSAAWDRMSLRKTVDYISPANFPKLIAAACSQPSSNLLRIIANNGGVVPVLQKPMPVLIQPSDLQSVLHTVAATPVPQDVQNGLNKLYSELGAAGMVISDRRWEQAVDTVRAQAVLEGRTVVDSDDLVVLKNGFWNNNEQRQVVSRIVAKLANPINASALDLLDQAKSVYDSVMQQVKANPSLSGSQAVIEANQKLINVREKLRSLRDQAKSEGRKADRIVKSGIQVRDWNEAVASLITGRVANDDEM